MLCWGHMWGICNFWKAILVNLSSWLVELQLLVKCSTCWLAEIIKFSHPPSLPSSLTLIVVHKLHNLVTCRSLFVFITYLYVFVVAAVMDGKGWSCDRNNVSNTCLTVVDPHCFWSIDNNPNVAVLAIKNVNSRYNKKNCCCCSGLYFNIETCWPTETVEKTWKLQEIAFRRPLVQRSCLAGPLRARGATLKVGGLTSDSKWGGGGGGGAENTFFLVTL